jgi:hypothetical protein
VTPLAGQARHEVLGLGQLNLQARLTRLGALGEDIDNQRRAVQDFDVQSLLQVALLRRAQLVVEDHHRVVGVLPLRDDLLELAFADVRGGVRVVQLLDRAPDHHCAGRVCQQRQLIQRCLGADAGVTCLAFDRHQICALDYGLGGVHDVAGAIAVTASVSVSNTIQ